MKICNVLLVVLMFLLPGLVLADKTDIIILKNGDRVTGEITRLDAGQLEFNTDTMGRVKIDWLYISEIISNKNQAVETITGQRYVGTLQKPDDRDDDVDGDHVIIETVRGPIELPPEELVTVWPVEAGFLDKMDLAFALGLDYARSTDIGNLNLSTDFRYLTIDRRTEATLRTDITRQSSGDEQTRTVMTGLHEYMLPEMKFRNWNFSIESNDALGLNLRVSGGAAFGRYLVKTNNTWFSLSGGLAATQESPDGKHSETNLEAVGSVRYRFFRYSEPERSLDTSFNVYPSLTDTGRVRADLRNTFKLELVRDFFWAMEIYADYDNEPLAKGDTEKLDYGMTTSIGWSY